MGRRSGTGLLVAILMVGTSLMWAAPAQAARLMCFGRPATIIGTAGNDTLIGRSRPDVIVGLGGDDLIDVRDGVSGNDATDGGADSDACFADVGDTVIGCESVGTAG